VTTTVLSDASRATVASPAGFIERRIWGGQLWVRAGFERKLPLNRESLEAAFRRAPGVHTFSGRGSCYSIPVGTSDRVVLRHYHHGGLLAPLTGDLFWGPTPRPLVEMQVSEQLRSRGVLTPEVLGMFWRYCGLWFYEADLVTREVTSSVDLAKYLLSSWNVPAQKKQRRQVIETVGRALLGMHEAGLDHPDLNLRNLLVQRVGQHIDIWVLDLDKARIVDPLPESFRLGQLRRLQRSLDKLSKSGTLADSRDRMVFLRSYWGPQFKQSRRRRAGFE